MAPPSLHLESEVRMRRYLTIRVVQAVITFFLFLTAVFFLIDAQPGDFGSVYYSNPKMTVEQRRMVRELMGLDKPVGERYLHWLGNFLHGDLGVALSENPRTVTSIILERAPRTLALFLTATVLAFYLGFLAGKLLAWRRGGFLEYASTLGGVTLYTVFTPWFGLMMIWLFSLALGLFPTGKFINVDLWSNAPANITTNLVFIPMILTGILVAGLLLIWSRMVRRFSTNRRNTATWIGMAVIILFPLAGWILSGLSIYALDILYHLALPVITLTLISFAGTMLLTRNSMLETLREDYIITARAKGLSENVIRDKHAARNAMLPVVTSFVFSLAFAIDGGIITESIFSWPGMGRTLLNAAQVADIPLAIGALVFTGILALSAHIVADVLYAYLDPRIRYQ
jgi:peptide/nickel transport system permease protein